MYLVEAGSPGQYVSAFLDSHEDTAIAFLIPNRDRVNPEPSQHLGQAFQHPIADETYLRGSKRNREYDPSFNRLIDL